MFHFAFTDVHRKIARGRFVFSWGPFILLQQDKKLSFKDPELAKQSNEALVEIRIKPLSASMGMDFQEHCVLSKTLPRRADDLTNMPQQACDRDRMTTQSV